MRAKVQAHFPANRHPTSLRSKGFEVKGMLRVVDFWFAHDKFPFLGWMDKKAPTGPLAWAGEHERSVLPEDDGWRHRTCRKEIRSLKSHWSWPDPKQTSRQNRLFLCSVSWLSFEDPERHMGREHGAHLDNYEDGGLLFLFRGETRVEDGEDGDVDVADFDVRSAGAMLVDMCLPCLASRFRFPLSCFVCTCESASPSLSCFCVGCKPHKRPPHNKYKLPCQEAISFDRAPVPCVERLV